MDPRHPGFDPWYAQLKEEEIMELNIPTGVPLVYEFNDELKARSWGDSNV
jgi:bisphosphoglycerate-dependent phosphoglycerate mutase